MHARTRTHTHTYTHACTHTHACMHTHTRMHMHGRNHAHTHTPAHTHTHTHTRTCTHTDTYTHTCTHTHTHTHTVYLDSKVHPWLTRLTLTQPALNSLWAMVLCTFKTWYLLISNTTLKKSVTGQNVCWVCEVNRTWCPGPGISRNISSWEVKSLKKNNNLQHKYMLAHCPCITVSLWCISLTL